jgi:anti-sigma B factor antagonist
MPEQQIFRIWSLGGLPVISTPEELDVSNAGQLREALLATSNGHVVIVVDMSATTFCDSTSLGVLVRAARQAATSGGELRLVIDTPLVLRIFTVTGVDKVFSIFSGLPEALAAKTAVPQPLEAS